MNRHGIMGPLTALAHRVEQFGKALPQEKVALHLDNTSYYQGDDIWFQCYVVASGLNRPTEWSKTLYVELLNPGGEIVSKQILPVRNGRCHGHFALTQLPFYSGFYEVRAYTKYMLNFDEASVFSRIIPVFDKPEVPGHYVEKEISPRVGKYPQERKRPRKEKKLNLRFYPEGGYLVKDVPVRVAFEATDASPLPRATKGKAALPIRPARKKVGPKSSGMKNDTVSTCRKPGSRALPVRWTTSARRTACW